jgi:hypothetical protein
LEFKDDGHNNSYRTVDNAMPPLLLGVINKTKAWFAGRNGPPVLQLYYDLIKLMRKGHGHQHHNDLGFYCRAGRYAGRRFPGRDAHSHQAVLTRRLLLRAT